MAAPMYDYEGENQNILRQQKIAEAMLAQGMAPPSPTEVVSGYAVKQPMMGGLAKVLQAYLGGRGVETAEGKRRELANRYNADLKTGIGDLINGMAVQPGESVGVNDESGGHSSGALSPQQAQAHKRAAILNAIGSGHPVLQQLGMSQLQSMGKDNVTVKDLLPHADPNSIPGMVTGGTGNFKPKKDIGEVGGVVYDKNTMRVVELKGGYDPQAQVTIAGDRYQLNPSSGKFEKMDNAPKITNTTNVHPGNVHLHGQKAGFEEWSKQAAKRVAEMSEKAESARNLESRMVQLENLTNAGTVSGPAAAPAVFLMGLAKQLGVKVDENRLANSATFESEATRAWAEMMQSMGGARGLVKEESEKIAASLPSLVQSPQGRKQIIALIRQAARQQQADAVKANEEYSKALTTQNPALFTFGLSSTMLPQSPVLPPAAGSASPTPPAGPVMTFKEYQEYLRKQGGR